MSVSEEANHTVRSVIIIIEVNQVLSTTISEMIEYLFYLPLLYTFPLVPCDLNFDQKIPEKKIKT